MRYGDCIMQTGAYIEGMTEILRHSAEETLQAVGHIDALPAVTYSFDVPYKLTDPNTGEIIHGFYSKWEVEV